MQDPISPEGLSALIALIYDAAIDPEQWPVAMEAMRLALDFEVATLNLHLLASAEVLLNITCNVPAAYVPLIDELAPEVLERWGGERVVAGLPMHEPAVLSWVSPDFDLATTTNRYYREFAQPQGLIDVLGIGLARDAGSLGSLAFGRHERAGPIGDREVRLARLLLPHLQRAATVNRMMDRARLAQSTLASLRAPILLVDEDLRLIHANPAAEAILRTGDPMRLVDGQLVAAGAGVGSALAVAIRQAAVDEAGLDRKGLGIPLRSKDGAAGALHVMPIGGRHRAAAHGAVAAVFIARAGTAFLPPTEIVAALFGLTPAEARVFGAAARGETIDEIAGSVRVGRSTAKTHLLRVYEKLGVRKQLDLVQIALSLAPPAAA